LTPRYDVERLGILLEPSPRHADVLLVTGVVTRQCADRLKRIYEQMPKPKFVVAIGACACSGGALTFLLIAVTRMPASSAVLAATILFLMGFAYALFLVFTLSYSMELMPERKAGLFNVLVGVGGACGSFIGPFLADTLGFTYALLTSGIVFFLAYIAFKVFT